MSEYKVLISGNYNVFNEGWDGIGVYMCSGLYISETFKFPIYIGSSVELQNRIEYRHIPRLRKNKHMNNPFQISWNKHSEKEGFIWWLLETCPKDQTLIYEQKYLDLYRPFLDEFGGFNINHDASAPGKNKSGKLNPFYGKKHTEESKQKMAQQSMGNKNCLGKKCDENKKQKIRDKNKNKHFSSKTEFKKGQIPWNKGIPRSEETKIKLSIANTGKKLSEETKNKISQSLIKSHKNCIINKKENN